MITILQPAHDPADALNTASGEPSSLASLALPYLTCVVLAASVVLGGGTRSGLPGDLIVAFLSLPLLCAALYEPIRQSPNAARLKWPLVLLALIVALPLLQLMPLPRSVWPLLPGRSFISEPYSLLGEPQPIFPLTMSPSATWLKLLSLLPPIALFLGCLLLSWQERRRLALLIVAVAVASVFLGLIQLAQGPNSSLRFFEITNNQDAVGFFANRNHFAAFLYSAMLFAAVWLMDALVKTGLMSRRRVLHSSSLPALIFFLAAFSAVVIAQLFARSRAGLGLALVGLFAALAIAVTDHRAVASRAHTAKITLGTAAAAIVFALQFALYRISERFEADPLSDARLTFAHNTIEAAKAYMPFGSGLGTFVPIYEMFEKPADVMVVYANHAHNDFLELWLETGVAGIALMAMFCIWFAHRAYHVWRGQDHEGTSTLDLSLARASLFVIALLVLHSFVDYPLRTTAMLSIFAVCCAMLVPPPEDTSDDTTSWLPHADVTGRYRDFDARNGQASRPPPPVRPTGKREPWGSETNWPEAWRSPRGGKTKKPPPWIE